MTILWFSIILIYFGITLHMSSLGGNIYINTVNLIFDFSILPIFTSPWRQKSLEWKINSSQLIINCFELDHRRLGGGVQHCVQRFGGT